MLCEKCHENEASFNIGLSSGHVTRELNICEICAISDSENKILVPHFDTNRKCPNCHLSYSKLSLLLGCPICYTEFHEELKTVINRIHGSTVHIGRIQESKNDVKGYRNRKSYSLPHKKSPLPAKARWVQGTSPDSDVIISTRIRLARNISDYLFSNSADNSQLLEVATIIESTLSEIGQNPESPLYQAYIIDLSELDELDRQLLVERYLISSELYKKAEGKGPKDSSPFKVILNENETVSIMINEEDHIRLQVINPGLQLEKSWELIKSINIELKKRLEYALSKEWGYLTACPTNVGTGLRASVMIHIPAMASTKAGRRMLSSVTNMGYAVRGIYGEGSQGLGAFYQISNELTLGQSEEEIISRIRQIIQQIVNFEREQRKILIEKNRMEAEDKIFRAYGILMNARMISSKEALELLSWIGLGLDTGILSIKEGKQAKMKIPQLLVIIRPAHLQKHEDRELDPITRDISRAKVIRRILGE